MIRNFKALGLALFVVFALGAVASASASASVNVFDSATNPTWLTGTSENTQVFTRESGGVKIECTHAAFKGTVEGTFNGTNFTTSTVVLNAEYTTPTCTGPLGSEVHVNFTTNGCGYHFTGTASKTAAAKLVCSGGTGVLITPTIFGSSLCTITVPPQETGGHVVFSNYTEGEGANLKKSVTAESTATGITSTRNAGGSSACGPEHSVGGTYTGNAKITGYKDINGVEGEQVNIEAT